MDASDQPTVCEGNALAGRRILLHTYGLQTRRRTWFHRAGVSQWSTDGDGAIPSSHGGANRSFLCRSRPGRTHDMADRSTGAVLHGPLTGVVAALLLATSPIFLYQLLQPVSDVPAAAWWTLSLFLLTRAQRAAALGAGIAASMAVLTRPNLAPLLVVICGYLVC